MGALCGFAPALLEQVSQKQAAEAAMTHHGATDQQTHDAPFFAAVAFVLVVTLAQEMGKGQSVQPPAVDDAARDQ
jgi:hypothetical protein